MTWKRELAFWSFMFLVALWMMYAVVSVGSWITENHDVRVAIERTR